MVDWLWIRDSDQHTPTVGRVCYSGVALVVYIEVGGSHFSVMGRGVVLSKVVGQVDVAALPVDLELALLGAVLHPVEPHVHGFRAFDFCSAIGETIGRRIVGGDSGRLVLRAA